MRNISFALTTPQFADGSKDVTRRLGWAFLKVGDQLMGCEKCQGIEKGGLVRLGVIEVLSVRRESLAAVDFCGCHGGDGCYGCDEAHREGFPGMTGPEFVEMFCEHMKCDPETEVTRIEFKHVCGIQPCPLQCAAGEVDPIDDIHRRSCPNCVNPIKKRNR